MTDPVYRGRYRGKKYKRKVKPLGLPDTFGRLKMKQVRPQSKSGNLLKEKAMKDPLGDLVKFQKETAAEEDAAISEYLQKMSARRIAGSGWSAAKRSAAAKKGWETRRRNSGKSAAPIQYKPGKRRNSGKPVAPSLAEAVRQSGIPMSGISIAQPSRRDDGKKPSVFPFGDGRRMTPEQVAEVVRRRQQRSDELIRRRRAAASNKERQAVREASLAQLPRLEREMMPAKDRLQNVVTRLPKAKQAKEYSERVKRAKDFDELRSIMDELQSKNLLPDQW